MQLRPPTPFAITIGGILVVVGLGACGALPAECDKERFPTPECLGALDEHCQSYDNEEDCSGEERFVFASVDAIRCAWASAVTFDGPSCGVTSSVGRCFAFAETEFACSTECGSPGIAATSRFHVLEAESTLVLAPCDPHGRRLDGPVLEPSESAEKLRWCGETPPPALCACVPQACEAQ